MEPVRLLRSAFLLNRGLFLPVLREAYPLDSKEEEGRRITECVSLEQTGLSNLEVLLNAGSKREWRAQSVDHFLASSERKRF